MAMLGNQIPIDKKRGNALLSLWQRLTKPIAANENDAQREYMIKVILVFIGLVSALFLVISIFGWMWRAIPPDTVLILAIMVGFL